MDIYPIHPKTITNLVPTRKIRGDHEFGGGPLVNVSTNLRISPGRRRLLADVFFRAEETKDDQSTVEQTWRDLEVWTAPPGRVIRNFRGAPTSSAAFRGNDAGVQVVAPTTDAVDALGVVSIAHEFLKPIMKAINPIAGAITEVAGATVKAFQAGLKTIESQGNTVHIVIPRGGDGEPFGPVEFFAIVADTGGDDISDDENPKDDTRIVAIKFREQIEVTVEDESDRETVPIFSWWSASRRDNFATSKPDWAGRPGDRRAGQGDYRFIRVEGSLFSPDHPQPENTVPVHLWWSEERADNVLASDLDGSRSAPDDGYVWVGLQGYALHPDIEDVAFAVPLSRWFSEARGDHFTTTLPDWIGRPGDTRADHDGYRFVRLEGWVPQWTIPLSVLRDSVIRNLWENIRGDG